MLKHKWYRHYTKFGWSQDATINHLATRRVSIHWLEGFCYTSGFFFFWKSAINSPSEQNKTNKKKHTPQSVVNIFGLCAHTLTQITGNNTVVFTSNKNRTISLLFFFFYANRNSWRGTKHFVNILSKSHHRGNVKKNVHCVHWDTLDHVSPFHYSTVRGGPHCLKELLPQDENIMYRIYFMHILSTLSYRFAFDPIFFFVCVTLRFKSCFFFAILRYVKGS